MSNNFYQNLTNHYSVNKTLTLELKPVGATREHLCAHQIIESDETIAECFAKIKKMIDEVHKTVIEEALTDTSLSDKKILSEIALYDYYESFLAGDLEQLKSTEEVLRNAIVKKLKEHPYYNGLFGEKVVKETLPKFAKTQEEMDVIDVFNRFTTYLTNYHKGRETLYSAEEKHFTVAYRLIHENLPKHMQNLRVYERLCASDCDINFFHEIKALEEFLGKIKLEDVFSVNGFNSVLTQKGIDRYNQIVGGIATENTKLKGLNEVINLWNQAHPTEKLPKFSPLYKQMLSDAETKSFVIDKFENDEQVYEALERSFEELATVTSTKIGSVLTYESFYGDIKEYDKNGIFISSDKLADLSVLLFGKWNLLKSLISLNYDKNYAGKKKPTTAAYDTEKEKALKKVKAYSVAELEEIIVNNSEDVNHADILGVLRANALDILSECKVAERELKHALSLSSKSEKTLKKNDKLISAMKTYLDSIKDVQSPLRLLQANMTAAMKDERFYSDLTALWDSFLPFNSLYNKVRDYVTAKPFSKDKLKLNFGSASFLNGWDSDNIDTRLGILFTKGDAGKEWDIIKSKVLFLFDCEW